MLYILIVCTQKCFNGASQAQNSQLSISYVYIIEFNKDVQLVMSIWHSLKFASITDKCTTLVNGFNGYRSENI